MGERVTTSLPSGTGAHAAPADAGRAVGRAAGHPLRVAAITLAFTLALLLVLQLSVVRMFRIPSASMEPTLVPGDRVAVDLLTPGPGELHRGDVVVFRDARAWLAGTEAEQTDPLGALAGLVGADSPEGHLVKRVIGLPGDRVRWSPGQGRLEVNGRPVDEPYLAGEVAEEPFDVTVPAGSLWVMGDHREASQDSRQHQDGPGSGFVAADDVVGRVAAVVWPLGRVGTVGTDGDGGDA